MPIIAELTITMDDQGRVQCTGAIGNMLVAFGLLEMAKQTIVAHHAAQQRTVQPASADELARLHAVPRKD